MMQIEIREDSVLITGYVNAVERLSKPITQNLGGKVRTFLEKIKSGTFKRALEQNDDVLVLLNHNADRQLARTGDGSAKLEEDNIGLRAEIVIKDEEVIDKARAGKLSGWSFGFRSNADELNTEGESEVRTLTDIDLVEVSILDDEHRPAYYGTSIEAREEGSKELEIRAEAIEEIEVEDEMLKKEQELAKMNVLAELIAQKVLMALKPEPREEREEIPEEVDFTTFEERLQKLKK